MPVSALNLRYFLSGGASNSDPLLSIGGAKSSVQLSSTALHNLFDRVTGDEAAAGVTRYRWLYFSNVDANASGLMAPVVLYFTALPTNGDFITAGVFATKNTPVAALATELVAPSPALSFSAPLTKAAGISLPTEPYAQGDYVGICFKHTVSAGRISSIGNIFSWAVVGDSV